MTAEVILESPPCEPFAIPPALINSPKLRLAAWEEVCKGGAMNLVNVDGVLWSWSMEPRLQKNGAAIGRIYRQARGELLRDVGSYKIAANGQVLALPEELRAILPGGAEAQASGPEEEGP